MRKVTFYLKKYFTAEGHAQTERERAARRRSTQTSQRAQTGTGTSTPASASSNGHEYEWPSGGNPTRSHRPPPSGVTVSDRPIGQQRQRRTRRRRRTASPVGLPLYSEEPRDQEMSLFKHQTTDLSMSSSRLDLALSPTIEVEDVSEDERPDQEEEEEEEVGVDSASEFVRPSFDNSASDHGVVGGSLSPSPLQANRPRSASESLVRMSSRNPYGSNSSSPFASRSGLIDLPAGQLNSLSPAVSRDGTSTPPRSGFLGHRPTRSSPISAMARRGSSPPRPNLGRPRASTLQRVLGGRNSSSGFLPLGTTGRSPYGQTSGGGSPSASGANSPAGSRSLQRFATGSTTSINTLDISEPVPGSFVHSSFVFPKNGPTPEQVKFIASRENLGAYGYFGQSPSEPPPFDPSTSSPSSPSSPPLSLSPLVDGVGGLSLGRPISMTYQTPGRGRSGSAASSPLARQRSPSPPPFEDTNDRGTRRHSLAQETRAGDDDEEDEEGELPFTVDEEQEETSNSSTELPPIQPVSPIDLESSSALHLVSSADSHAYPIPPPFNRLNTSSPPPRIITQSATPINSANPSPAIPQDTFEVLRSRESTVTSLEKEPDLDTSTVKVQA
ncbi:hypothetical protein JCM3765_001082 [Sporobolomyces pararoseus]